MLEPERAKYFIGGVPGSGRPSSPDPAAFPALVPLSGRDSAEPPSWRLQRPWATSEPFPPEAADPPPQEPAPSALPPPAPGADVPARDTSWRPRGTGAAPSPPDPDRPPPSIAEIRARNWADARDNAPPAASGRIPEPGPRRAPGRGEGVWNPLALKRALEIVASRRPVPPVPREPLYGEDDPGGGQDPPAPPGGSGAPDRPEDAGGFSWPVRPFADTSEPFLPPAPVRPPSPDPFRPAESVIGPDYFSSVAPFMNPAPARAPRRLKPPAPAKDRDPDRPPSGKKGPLPK
ncbi:MAG: hypothetical protein LBQ79_08320 [Deltaproteobacteria bacterium]|jgi:hypothetical protein|nr:hypothetical protein [Deltaproteobacteria bacterium]